MANEWQQDSRESVERAGAIPELRSISMPTSTHVAAPVAALGGLVPSGRIDSLAAREVIVTVARAALGTRVYLESQPQGGPSERIRAFALPTPAGSQKRAYRAVLPPLPPGAEGIYVPLAVQDGREIRGEALRLASPTSVDARGRAMASPALGAKDVPPALPAMELLAHVEARLPKATIFGATPEGVQLAFYITEGRWIGPRIRAHYRSEGGDWMLVRKDGVGIPNARATLETDHGALLYYQLSGTVDLGDDGYARVLANDFPDVAPLSVVGKIATSSERWSWLNRLTIVGAGLVKLKTGNVCYDIYSIGCDPSGHASSR